MKTAARMVCKGFLDRCPPQVQEGLLQLLPQEEQLQIREIPPLIALEPDNLKWDLLDQIHFSWLSPYLRTLAEGEIPLFLAALNKEQIKGLQKALGFGNHLPELTNLSSLAFRSMLLTQVVQNQELTPFAFLPEHPLNTLLNLNTETLGKVVVYLGLHDLSFEMRQIISTAILKKIFAALPKKEGEYLNALILHREPLTFQRLFLEKWDGSKEKLLKLVEERGLQRLAYALYGADSSLIWYVTRKLDMHLGTTLLKYNEKPTHTRTGEILGNQIRKILNTLNKEKSP